MTSNGYPEQYYVKCDWTARPEDPNRIADRLRQFLDTLGEVHQTLRPWSIGERRRAPYPSVRDDLAETIRRDVVHGEDGTVKMKAGYTIVGSTSDRRQHYRLVGHAGGAYDTFMCNELGLNTCTYSSTAVDPAIVDYPVMKAMVLTMIACWEPDFCLAGSGEFAMTATGIWYERSCWITYVPPGHAASVDLVGVPFSEGTPDGGLLLSATDQSYDVKNPAHIDGSRRITQATKHLNATLLVY